MQPTYYVKHPDGSFSEVPAASVQPESDRALFEKHITDNHPTACLDRHPNLPYLYALSWVNEGWLAWRKAISGVQPDIGRDAALGEALREMREWYRTHGNLHHTALLWKVDELIATQASPEVASIPNADVSPDSVVETNVALMRQRSAVGVEKYKTTLAESGLPVRGLLVHALEESLDMANYIQAVIQQTDVLAAAQQPKASYD